MSFFRDGEVRAHKVAERTRDEGYTAAMGGIVVGTIDIEDKAAHVTEQNNTATAIYKGAQEMQVGLDDAQAQRLRGRHLEVTWALLAQQIAAPRSLRVGIAIGQAIDAHLTYLPV